MYPQALQVLVTSDMSISWISKSKHVSNAISSNFVFM